MAESRAVIEYQTKKSLFDIISKEIFCHLCKIVPREPPIYFSSMVKKDPHSSEKRILCLKKSSSKRLQNLPYSVYIRKPKVVFSIFHFVLLYLLPIQCQHRSGNSLGKK